MIPFGRAHRHSASQLLLGVVMVCAFFALDRTTMTIQVRFVPPWDASVPGELYFWLGAITFLLPGCALVGCSASRVLGPWLARISARLQGSNEREQAAVMFAIFVSSWALARLGNQLVMHGQPFTDDEDAARFGGQVLAQGSLWAPVPPMRFAFPELFLFQRDGQWTSFDFVGALAVWAVAEWTRSETLVFSLLAALVAPSLASAVSRQRGPAQGLATAALVLCSPMALTLSATSHTHVVSRGLLALGLGLILFVERASLGRSLAAGIALGLALITRPPEVFMVLLPLGVGALYQGVRDPLQRPRLLGLLAGALPAVLAMFAYNYALTDSFGFPRSAANEISVPYGSMMRGPFVWARWDDRFGNNFAYNTLTLSIWFLGPLGLPLAFLGARRSRTHALLGLGVLLALSLCLLHDDRGLHMVGPIHLSETVVPLAILASTGLDKATEALQKVELAPALTRSAALGYGLLGLVTFTLWHARALEVQARARVALVEVAENVPQRPAVVLAERYSSLRDVHSSYAHTGGFVFEWRRARPDLSDPVLIVHDSPQARQQVRIAFPDRTAYVLDPIHLGMKPVPLATLPVSQAP